MAPRKESILAVDDDICVLRLEQRILEAAGYSLTKAHSGEEALRVIAERSPALVLLDITLPGIDGFATCQLIREFTRVPVIMVTAKEDHEDKVRGLELGSDDYITKPFWPNELVARVDAVLRRFRFTSELEKSTIEVGELVIDLDSNRVTIEDQEVLLSATEFRLLSYLAVNRGRILTPSQILEHVWSAERAVDIRMLRVTIQRLRQKLGDDPRAPRYIMTRTGIGYGLCSDRRMRVAHTPPERGGGWPATVLSERNQRYQKCLSKC